MDEAHRACAHRILLQMRLDFSYSVPFPQSPMTGLFQGALKLFLCRRSRLDRPAQREHARPAHKIFEIGAGKAIVSVRERLGSTLASIRHAARGGYHGCAAARRIGEPAQDELVESPGLSSAGSMRFGRW